MKYHTCCMSFSRFMVAVSTILTLAFGVSLAAYSSWHILNQQQPLLKCAYFYAENASNGSDSWLFVQMLMRPLVTLGFAELTLIDGLLVVGLSVLSTISLFTHRRLWPLLMLCFAVVTIALHTSISVTSLQSQMQDGGNYRQCWGAEWDDEFKQGIQLKYHCCGYRNATDMPVRGLAGLPICTNPVPYRDGCAMRIENSIQFERSYSAILFFTGLAPQIIIFIFGIALYRVYRRQQSIDEHEEWMRNYSQPGPLLTDYAGYKDTDALLSESCYPHPQRQNRPFKYTK